jgi:hypothetical protein
MSHHGSPRYGARAESRAIDARGYRRENMGPWHDAVDQNGTPVEIKAAMRERSNGKQGRFRVFEEPHERLQREEGRYLFVVYRARGTGVEMLATEEMPARELRIRDWVHSGHKTDGREMQRRIPISEIFNP